MPLKTTLDIHDDGRKRHAKKTGRPLRAVVEDGLRQVLAAPPSRDRYRLPDLSTGRASAEEPRPCWNSEPQSVHRPCQRGGAP